MDANGWCAAPSAGCACMVRDGKCESREAVRATVVQAGELARAQALMWLGLLPR